MRIIIIFCTIIKCLNVSIVKHILKYTFGINKLCIWYYRDK